MRIALHADGEFAVRTSKVILAKPSTEVGIFEEEAKPARLHVVESLEDWDVLVVEATTIASRVQIERAYGAGIPVVLATEDLPLTEHVPRTSIVGVLSGPRLAIALARHATRDGGDLIDAAFAWTIPGHPLSDGVATTFPDPVGPLWADRAAIPETAYAATGVAAPTKTSWRGVTARVTVGTGDGIRERVVGLVDDASFLNAVCLAAAGMTAAEGAYATGVHGPGDEAGVFIANAQRAGLDIASFEPAA